MLKPKQKSVMVSIMIGVLGFVGAYLAGHAGIPRQSDIIVAARTLKPGETLTNGDITIVPVPGKVPPTIITKQTMGKFVNQAVDYEIPAGVPVSENYFSSKPEREGLYEGQVGIWLAVSLNDGGDVMPGDRVDVFTSTNNAMQAAGSPVLSYVRVVRSVNSNGDDLNRVKQVSTVGATPLASPGVPAAVELAVTTQQADLIASLTHSSHLLLALSPWSPADNSSSVAGSVQPVIPGQIAPGQSSSGQTGQQTVPSAQPAPATQSQVQNQGGTKK
ncbi:MAG: SAF domain-containing protein [Peptococcaceae bacterium]|nr:SAF domain-containing protein [Peptococcaceae bacterium]